MAEKPGTAKVVMAVGLAALAVGLVVLIIGLSMEDGKSVSTVGGVTLFVGLAVAKFARRVL